MKTIEIKSDKPITDDTVNKVRGIFSESQCPNESLFHTFENFTSFNGAVVQFGNGDKYSYSIEVE